MASFNVHGGVDGWGRPFDVVGACRRLDADVLVLQETWTPTGGPGLAEQVGSALGYRVTTASMAPALRYPPADGGGSRWGPVNRRRPDIGLRVDVGRRQARGHRSPPERGAVGVALLERLAEAGTDVVDLGRMGSDVARRFALRTTIGTDGSSLVVVGTHLAHIRQGSPLQLRRLHGMLPGPEAPAVLAGDMNIWGPPLTLLMPGWSRAVIGRSWPSWRPTFQIDHILVTPAVHVVDAEVVAVGRSDHLPVRATVAA